MQDFKKLEVWRRAHALSLDVFRATRRLPRRDAGAVANQLNRAALSIPTNIVEGAASPGNRAFARYLQIAISSSTETEHHLHFAADLGWLPRQDCERLISDTIALRKMLVTLLDRARAKAHAP